MEIMNQQQWLEDRKRLQKEKKQKIQARMDILVAIDKRKQEVTQEALNVSVDNMLLAANAFTQNSSVESLLLIIAQLTEDSELSDLHSILIESALRVYKHELTRQFLQGMQCKSESLMNMRLDAIEQKFSDITK